MSNSVFSAIKKISKSGHKITIDDVSSDTYAFSVFHDKNKGWIICFLKIILFSNSQISLVK
jgi:hypothetical protein